MNNDYVIIIPVMSTLGPFFDIKWVFRIFGDDVRPQTRRRLTSGNGGIVDGDSLGLWSRNRSWTHLRPLESGLSLRKWILYD